MSFSYYPTILKSFSFTPLPWTVLAGVSYCTLFFFFFQITVFLSHSTSAGAKLCIKNLIWWDTLTLHVCVLDSNQSCSQPTSQFKRSRQFPCLLVASVVVCCSSAERQEASVHCCCWEALCWAGPGQPAWLKAAATAVSLCWAQSPLCSTHCDEQKPPCCTHSWTHTHTARPSSAATSSVHYCHSFLTIPNSAHWLFSVGIIILIIRIILLSIALIVWRHTLFGKDGSTKSC